MLRKSNNWKKNSSSEWRRNWCCYL